MRSRVRFFRIFIPAFSLAVLLLSALFTFFIYRSVHSYTDRMPLELQKESADLAIAYNKELHRRSGSAAEQRALEAEYDTLREAQARLWLFSAYRSQMNRRLALTAGGFAGLLLLCWHLSLFILIRRYFRPLTLINRSLEEYREHDVFKPVLYQGPRSLTGMIEKFNRLLAELQEARFRERLSSRASGWRQLAAVMVHEMKNKLAPVSMALDLLEEECGSGGDVALVRRNIAVIERLAASLKNLSGLPAPELQPVVPADAVERIRRDNPAFGEVSLMDRKLGEAAFMLDPLYFDLILTNILKNGFEALPDEGGQVELRFEPDPEGGIRISIRDNGCGFSEAEAARLFKPGYTSKAAGDGIGLFVVRELAETLSLRLECRGKPGEGACFTIIIPRELRVRGIYG